MKPLSELGLCYEEIDGHIYVYKNVDEELPLIINQYEHKSSWGLLGFDKRVIASTELRKDIPQLEIQNEDFSKIYSSAAQSIPNEGINAIHARLIYNETVKKFGYSEDDLRTIAIMAASEVGLTKSSKVTFDLAKFEEMIRLVKKRTLLIETECVSYRIKKDENNDWIPYDEEYEPLIRGGKLKAMWK